MLQGRARLRRRAGREVRCHGIAYLGLKVPGGAKVNVHRGRKEFMAQHRLNSFPWLGITGFSLRIVEPNRTCVPEIVEPKCRALNVGRGSAWLTRPPHTMTRTQLGRVELSSKRLCGYRQPATVPCPIVIQKQLPAVRCPGIFLPTEGVGSLVSNIVADLKDEPHWDRNLPRFASLRSRQTKIAQAQWI